MWSIINEKGGIALYIKVVILIFVEFLDDVKYIYEYIWCNIQLNNALFFSKSWYKTFVRSVSFLTFYQRVWNAVQA